MSNSTLSPRALELYEASRKPVPRFWNAATQSMYLYGIVGMDIIANDVASALAEAKGPLTLYVNSPGGSFFDGKAIYSAIARYAQKNRVTCVVDGVAASAASLLAMAATRVEMSPGSSLMVHEVSGSVSGRASDMEAMAAAIRQENVQLAGIYASRTGKPVEDVLSMLAQGDTYFTAEQAVEQKFADSITNSAGMTPKSRPSAVMKRRITNLRIDALSASVKREPGQPGKK